MGSSTRRVLLLTANFMLVAMAYYLIKPASRSLVLEHLGVEVLPYLWIASALLLILVIPAYQLLMNHISRLQLLQGSLTLFVAMLIVMRAQLDQPDKVSAALFFVMVDIISVILVEQFWSLANTSFTSHQARGYYWFIGSGGLIGGIIGGVAATLLVTYADIATPDLIIVAILFLLLVMVLNSILLHTDKEPIAVVRAPRAADTKRITRENNYMFLIAAALFLAQLASPIIEYMFMSLVENRYTDQDQRTAFLSIFSASIGVVALIINLVITRALHENWGVSWGLLAQPLLIAGGCVLFYFNPGLPLASLLKISDKSLSYSVNRASRELLYVGIDSGTVFKAKAWIDILGFRISKFLGSSAILLLVYMIPATQIMSVLSWINIGICFVWGMAVIMLSMRYSAILSGTDITPVPVAAKNATGRELQ